MTKLSEQEMVAAVAARDKTFDGIFCYGVVTTGVFCRPSCTARAARTENRRFFEDTQSAIDAGFRPCKRCRPTEASPGLNKILEIARYIESHVDEQLTLAMLSKRVGLSPSRFQRKFKTILGLSPKAYQDAVRMKAFKSALKDGEAITGAIFSAGFGSISRVYGVEARHIGMTPKAYRSGGEGETIAYACRTTTLGPMMLAATERGVCFAQFGDSTDALLNQLRSEFPKAHLIVSSSQDSDELDAWMKALDVHVSQDGPRPDLPLDLRGTVFQMTVWKFLLSVREGDVISYSELAAAIDKPKAVRAAASACAANRIGVLVPCHRVLRGDGSLGGYRWGLERKRALLDAERSRITRSR